MLLRTIIHDIDLFSFLFEVIVASPVTKSLYKQPRTFLSLLWMILIDQINPIDVLSPSNTTCNRYYNFKELIKRKIHIKKVNFYLLYSDELHNKAFHNWRRCTLFFDDISFLIFSCENMVIGFFLAGRSGASGSGFFLTVGSGSGFFLKVGSGSG